MAGTYLQLPRTAGNAPKTVAAVGSLPKSAYMYDVYLVSGTNTLYMFDGKTWQSINMNTSSVYNFVGNLLSMFKRRDN